MSHKRNDEERIEHRSSNNGVYNDDGCHVLFHKVSGIIPLLIHSTTKTTIPTTEAIVVKQLQWQKKLCKMLYLELSLFSSNYNDNSGVGNDRKQDAWNEMSEYMMLPMTMIIKSFFQQQKNDNKNVSVIVSSARHQCVEAVAHIMSAWFSLLGSQHYVQSNNDKNDLNEKCLQTCFLGWSLLQTTTSNKTGTMSRLDLGEDAQHALLRTIQSILIYRNKINALALKSSSAGETYNWMVTTIVSLCVSVFEEKLPINHQPKVSINYLSTENDFTRQKSNAPLQLQALETLQTLISTSTDLSLPQVTIVSFWRSIFPGTFACLYRLSLQHLSNIIQSNSKILSKTLFVLSFLLKITLKKTKISATQQNNYSEKDHVIQDLKQALSSLTIDTSNNQNYLNLNTDGSKSNTVDYGDNEDRKQVTKAVSILLSTLSSSKNNISNNKNNSVSINKVSSMNYAEPDNEEKTFQMEVKKRIPTPLIVLFQLLPSSIQKSSSSENLILSSIHLCESILIDSRAFLSSDNDRTTRKENEATIMKLIESALECLLIMFQQENKKVSLLAQTVLSQYRGDNENDFNNNSWNHDKNKFVLPKLLELIKSFSTLAHSGREVELISKMNLSIGYLRLFEYWGETEQDMNKRSRFQQKNISTAKNKKIFLSLTRTIENTIRSSLSDLFLLDDNAVAYSPHINVVEDESVSNSKSITLLSGNDNNNNNFLHLRSDKAILEAKRMMNAISLALGPKQTALFVDSCIADLYEELLDYQQKENGIRTKHSGHLGSFCRFDKKFSEWLQPKLGLIAVTHELMVSLMIYLDMSSHSFAVNNPQRQMRKTKKIVKSLAEAIIPIILSDILFNLPTTLELTEIYDINNSSRKEHQYGVFHGENKSKIRNENDSTSSSFAHHYQAQISAIALTRNALMVSYLLKIIGVLSAGLGKEIIPFLSVLLYPILLKTSDCNHHYVQQSAFMVLKQLSHSTGGKSEIFSMVSKNFNHLIETISLDLRFPGEHMSRTWYQQQISIQSLHKVIDILCIRRNCKNMDMGCNEKSILDRRLIKIVELTNSSIEWFNKSFDKGSSDILKKKAIPRGLLRFFSAFVFHLYESLKHTLEVLENDNSNLPNDEHKKGNKWMMILSPFLQHTFLDDSSSPEEGFTKYGSFNEPKYGHKNDKKIKKLFNCHSLKHITSTLKRILCLSSFFLSSKHLQIQKICCEVFENGFECLATIQSIINMQKGFDEEKDNLGNPLLESIHEFWPPLFCKMREAVTILVESPSKQLYPSPRKLGVPTLNIELLLSSLIQIVSIISQSAGDFFTGRVEDAWPTISQILHHCLKKKVENVDLVKKIYIVKSTFLSTHERRHNGGKGNDILLISTLSCLEKIYSCSIELGMSLSHLIPVAGTIIMPLLSDQGQIGEVAMRALKSMLNIDCDSLWTSILTMSCAVLPERPLLGLPERQLKESSHTPSTNSILLKKNALLLVNYVRNLPERDL